MDCRALSESFSLTQYSIGRSLNLNWPMPLYIRKMNS
jgi:hypothetical protein